MTGKTNSSPLDKLGLRSSLDCALHIPIRYEDETKLSTIAEAIGSFGGLTYQVQGYVIRQEVMFRPRRQLLVQIRDDDGQELFLRWLNFYPSQQKQMSMGAHLRVRGEVRDGYYGPEMVHPVVKAVTPDAPLPSTLTPVYSTVAGVSQTLIRKAIAKAIQDPGLQISLKEFLPNELIAKTFPGLTIPTLISALQTLHQPSKSDDLESIQNRTHPAWRRVQLEELLAQQISLQQARQKRLNRQAVSMSPAPLERGVLNQFIKSLPFDLTGAQKKVWQEIIQDLSRAYPMNRLLQGDVGSGKTVIAALAALHAIDHGCQAAIMAPTEILAEQHYRKLKLWLEPLGVKIAWLTGSLKVKEKREAQEQISSGGAHLVIGTHALIQEGVEFAKLGFAVIDEQHRFGVKQRLQLQQKIDDVEVHCHQLMMSATPIPRTLAMTFYADLEVSVIDELPPGRSPIVTKLVKNERRQEVVSGLLAELAKGRQVYWVCPLIEESDTLQLKTAVETHEALVKALPNVKIGLVHGRLKSQEKNSVMQSFVSGDIQILVATTVIEVGVDVPNASLMVIEHAERFGYAQLHQLRGRVGRGSAESVCILLYGQELSLAAKERLQTLKETQDGFLIAERDLALRGPGELLGSKQSGDAMLRFIDLQKEQWLIEKTQQLSVALLSNYPEIAEQHLSRWLGSRAEYLKA
ncbi:ATP-dependent DNA helicase RecG [Polynucleobacter victoriensis]|uniref:ATP-dependent DNA helicase RecG n=1 Tax=Polynucleobacter victoriensis TaxID=2049319 RepID=A0A212TGC1_9BURK|nr:ATP-dependent DNA helicase RecG [Polynucleobacter victoriensis]SNC64871.1 ATP-dependent DNA helicase RecG [Polynucleobacter victoriensis]